MKSTKEKNQPINTTTKKSQLGLWIQAILCICGLTSLIISLLESAFIPLTEILVAFCLFTMAYNNQKLYKRNTMTYIYIGFGLFLIITTILDVFHG